MPKKCVWRFKINYVIRACASLPHIFCTGGKLKAPGIRAVRPSQVESASNSFVIFFTTAAGGAEKNKFASAAHCEERRSVKIQPAVREKEALF
jgi:hypothetical protein